MEKLIAPTQKAKKIHLPGLNGLRSIAALAVVISHITIGLNEFGLNNKIFGEDSEGNAIGLLLAGYGVTIFFTLSGFLITFLLLKEKEKIGHVKIKDFYVRRILRIWPLYYLYLAICLATIYAYGMTFPASSLPFYIFLAANIPFILTKSIPFVFHYWSLGVEEQFYLFFPQLAKLSNKKLFKVSILIIVVMLGLKALFWLYARRTGNNLPLSVIDVTRFHCMLVGVVGAILYYNRNLAFIKFTTNKITQLLSWFCVAVIALNKFHIASVIDGELVSIVSLCLIMGQVTKKGLLNLENKVCDFVGKISYGIYVIHPLIIFCFARAIGTLSHSLVSYAIVYLMITTATIFLAYLSYEFYEKRFLKIKQRFSTIHSVASKS